MLRKYFTVHDFKIVFILPPLSPCSNPDLTGTITIMKKRILSLTVFLLVLSVAAVTESTIPEADSTGTATSADTTAGSPIVTSPPRDTAPPANDSQPIFLKQPAQPVVPHDTVLSDTLQQTRIRDSLITIENSRRQSYAPDSVIATGATVTAGPLFRADATSWINQPVLRKLYTNPRIGIAGHGNRLLYMGNTAPLTRLYAGNRLLYETADNPWYGDDAWSSTEFNALHVGPDGSRILIPRAGTITSPESEFFWETGVFDENILLLRFTRPLSRHLQINVFSNYRHFKGTPFSHEGNDMYAIYSNLTRDTTLLSRDGYSPIVNEYFCGADIHWKKASTELYGRVKYGDITGEIPLDRLPAKKYPDFARITQFPLTFTGGIYSRAGQRFFADAECRWNSHPLRRLQSAVSGTGYKSASVKMVRTTIEGAGHTGIVFDNNDTLSLTGTIRRSKVSVADSLEPQSLEYRPEVRWCHPFTIIPACSSSVMLRGGADIFADDTSGVFSPVGNATLQGSFAAYRGALFFEQDLRHYLPPMDSLDLTVPLHDAYLRAGAQLEGTWNRFNLLAAYQWCYGIDTIAVLRSWASAAPPYRQPRSVFILAPGFGRWNGLGLFSRVMLSDTRPFLKVHGMFSILVFPKLTNEAFDIRLECNYWSEREAITFAEATDWNRSLLDMNFIATAHIKSFRLTYKIDNLLNRDFSYVPGYYSPGITFRWGFSWFIQR